MIRQATDADMPAVGKLFRDASYPDQMVDWSRPGLAPWWRVAEVDGTIVGAIQVVASQPFGLIGEILVHPDARGRREDGSGSLSGVVPGALATRLYLDALRLLIGAGVQVAYGIIHDDLGALQVIAERHGFERLGGPYGLYGRRLA